MIRAGIVGATGYVAEELFRLLLQHQEVRITQAVSSSCKGKRAEDVFPSLKGYSLPMLSEFHGGRLAEDCDVVFLALPHGASGPLAKELLSYGIKVIDLSADFRYKNPATYSTSYHQAHPCPELLPHAVYGLCEIYGDRIAKTSLLANPGCYTTCALLALIPLVESGFLSIQDLLIDAKSGISGAGNHPNPQNQFAMVSGNFKAYSVGTHRHTSEIEEQLSAHLPKKSASVDSGVQVVFTPHLLPVKRGILSTIYGRPTQGFSITAEQEVEEIFHQYYGSSPFVHINPPGTQPELSHVVGSNHLHIGFVVDRRTGRLIVTSVLDNLVKGAAGQAIQNMNIMFDLPQTEGLNTPAWYL